MCRSCLKNTFINRLEKHTYMDKFIDLATGCANGFTMPALWRHSCGGTDCYGDALWYAAQMHGFFAGCCGVSTSLQHLRCNCGSMVLRNVDAAVMRSVSNSASTFIHNCIADDEASVHHRACRLRCKVIAPCVAMLLSSAASAKQYACESYAHSVLHDADMRDGDVRLKLRSDDGCVSHDALTAVGGEISEDVRTYFNEYLQCADATASGENGYLVGIAHTPGGKCADVLSFPQCKATSSRRLTPHAQSAEWILNTNRANFTNGNVGSRLGATEWTGHHMRIFRTFRNGERNTPEDAYICPISAFSAAGQIMPRVPNEPSGNARKSLAGCGGRLSKSLWI